MPIHDWTRVSDGTFHDFHCTWIPDLKRLLNDGLLPNGYYAQVEQAAGGLISDILTLNAPDEDNASSIPVENELPKSQTPPAVQLTAILERASYASRRRTLVIRHQSRHRIVALIEVLSRGNKSSGRAFRAFLRKALSALHHGIHLVLVDLFPPTRRDPNGIHGALWFELGDPSYLAPSTRRLTLASYSAGPPIRAYVEPVAVGDRLTSMPLFLTPDAHIDLPLEASYLSAFASIPSIWRAALEAP